MDTSQVQAAISALYGSNAAEAERANTFLMEFTEQPSIVSLDTSDERCPFLLRRIVYYLFFERLRDQSLVSSLTLAAWAVSIELLSAPVVPESASRLQYFSANTLYTKVRKHWHQLDPEHREQLGGVILQLLRGSPSASAPQAPGSSPSPAVSYAPVVINRLCLALAAVAVRAPNGVNAYIREAFALSEGSCASSGGRSRAMIALSLQMIKILPQEVDGADLSRTRKLELQDQVREHTSTVLQELEAVLTSAAPDQGVGAGGQDAQSSAAVGVREDVEGHVGFSDDVVLAALNCLREWAQLGISLGRLATDHPRLMDRLVRMIGGAGAVDTGGQGGVGGNKAATAAALLPVVCGACNVIMELVAVQEYPRPPAREAAAEAILSAMGEMLGLFMAAIQGKDEDSASTMCNCLVAFAQREMPMVAGAKGKGLALVKLLLSLTGCNLARIPILTMDFWLELQDVPFSERHPALGKPVYMRLLEVLLSKCELPEGFVSWDKWDGEDVDEDALTELRDGAQGVKDVLVVIYYILRADYMSHLMERLRARTGSWQALEVTLLAVSSVSKEMRDWMDAHARGKDPEQAEDARRTHLLVSALLNELLVNASLTSVPLVLAAGCKLVGSFAALVGGSLGGGSGSGVTGGSNGGRGGMRAVGGGAGGGEGAGGLARANPGFSMLPLALGYLSAGLQQKESRDRAAISVRTIAAHCERSIVADPRSLDALLQTLEVARRAGADIEERLILIEACARVLPALEPATGSAMLMRLVSPLLHVLAKGLQSPGADENEVAEALQQLAQAVRFLDVRDSPAAPPPNSSTAPGGVAGAGAPGADRPHISTELVRTLWPMLDAVPGRFGDNPEVIRQLFSLLGKMLVSWRVALERQLHIPTLLKMIMDCYDERQYSSCLDMMTTAVEVYGRADEAAFEHFRAMLVRASARTFAAVQAAKRPGEVPQLIRAYFELLYRFLLFSPAALLGSAELDTALQLAVACVGASDLERESARSVLFFVGQLAGRCAGQLDRFRTQVEAALAARGEGLTRLMFAALAGALPSLLWPNLIDALYALLSNFSGPQHQGIAQQWVYGALRDERMCAALGEEEQQHVMDAIFRLLSDSRSRFKALMLDLAKICHNEMTKDGLLAYFL